MVDSLYILGNFLFYHLSVSLVSETGDLIVAAMLSTFMSICGLAVGLLYTGLQSIVPCLPPAPLSTAVIKTDQVKALTLEALEMIKRKWVKQKFTLLFYLATNFGV